MCVALDKLFPHQCNENNSLDLQNPYKMSDVVACIYNPTIRKVETGKFLELTGQPSLV
jgi:hypothetical protein